MATTRIIPMHVHSGHTIAQSLNLRTNYAINPEKTNGGEYVSAYECSPSIADKEFLYNRRCYEQNTGRNPRFSADERHSVLAYQVRQSFKPGEVTPEEVNRIGYEFASRFLKGKHAFLVATHIDKKHIHNHIIWDATALDASRKFRNFYNSTAVIRHLSDQICVEHGLSIVENPGKASNTQHYGEWLGEHDKPCNRDVVRQMIDEILQKKPQDFEAFLRQMELAGFTVKRGAHITFCSPKFKRNIRMDSLGDGYTEAEVEAMIRLGSFRKTQRRSKPVQNDRPSLLIDIQKAINAGKGKGYENWAKHFNLTQMAKAVLYLKEHSIDSYEELAQKAEDATSRVNALRMEIRAAEKRMKEISALRTQIIHYAKTKKIYADYRASGYSKRFYTEHEAEIEMHKQAKTFFDKQTEFGKARLPSVKGLSDEYNTVRQQKNKAYIKLRDLQETSRDLIICSSIAKTIVEEECELPNGRSQAFLRG